MINLASGYGGGGHTHGTGNGNGYGFQILWKGYGNGSRCCTAGHDYTYIDGSGFAGSPWSLPESTRELGYPDDLVLKDINNG
jgi:hypothetical protein